MKTININFDGIDLRVTGDYSKAEKGSADRVNPPFPATFQLSKIFCDDVDVTETYGDKEVERIEELCLEEIVG
jgi:hypothetical protein